ncbi:transmembrane protein, putative (macronuclear) [Tetrahymena thermophila SB210]|uniref:Transmembrane protein, putative n=1 Tax=Tetrahymena thermophila (strain SB210) TaxID=312017 RepID=I7LV04_TETTS|nr:transmembrane protein, putative [Tetrahymena thermophila SB210]EAR96406.3 transmembrane protein, putative [Tetrahymena thermophila SB210]|eukprot:XP_001016651.3 transmembrane protein, putative [Tetrahymena thermophila SB210]
MNPQFQASQHPNQQGYVSTGIPGQVQKQPVNVQNVLFLTGTVLAAINCFARADYNLPVFLVSYLLWEQDYGREQTQRARILYLLMFCTFVDFFYIIYWGSSISVFTKDLEWLNSVYVFTIIMTAILMVIKFVILFRATQTDQTLQEKVSVQGITNSLSAFFASDPYGQNSLHAQNYPAQQPQQAIPQQPNFQQNVYGYDSQNMNQLK